MERGRTTVERFLKSHTLFHSQQILRERVKTCYKEAGVNHLQVRFEGESFFFFVGPRRNPLRFACRNNRRALTPTRPSKNTHLHTPGLQGGRGRIFGSHSWWGGHRAAERARSERIETKRGMDGWMDAHAHARGGLLLFSPSSFCGTCGRGACGSGGMRPENVAGGVFVCVLFFFPFSRLSTSPACKGTDGAPAVCARVSSLISCSL